MEALAAALVSKIREQMERTVSLIALAPADRREWRPPITGAWSLGELLGHLPDCVAGFCAVLYAAYPERLEEFVDLRSLPVNQLCGPEEARQRIELYRLHLDQGFEFLRDADLGRTLPTVFVAEGEPMLTLLLGNLEHLINHKHQLFMYLKLMGVNVGTPELYRLRVGKGKAIS